MANLTQAPMGKKAVTSGSSADNHQYLTFRLGGEMFALMILRIKEILEYGQVTQVPMMPSFLRGVINLRGSVVPVVDLQARFGRASSQVTRRTCIVILETSDGDDHQDIGLVVDAVSAVLEIPSGEIEPPPSFGAHIRADFIDGMGKVNGEFVMVLDPDQVLSVQEMAQMVGFSEAESPALTRPVA